jgi:ribosome-associated protein
MNLYCSTIGQEVSFLNAATDRIENTPEQFDAPAWLVAARAAESKKATDVKILDLNGVTSFTDYFVLCTGSNPRQIQAIADEIGLKLKERGELPISMEGYSQAEWILADYGDFLIHIFSEKARAYYDLERLWRAAKIVPIPAE